MNKTIVTIIGFALFLSGMYALVLSLVGAKFTPLYFLEQLGSGGAFLVKLAMVMFGILIIVLSRTKVQEEGGFPPEESV